MPWMVPAAIVASAVIGGMMQKDSGGSVSSYQNPQQQQMFNMFQPLWNRLAGAGTGGQYQIGTQQQSVNVPGQWGLQNMGDRDIWGQGPSTTQMMNVPLYAQSSGQAWKDLGVPMPTEELMSSISPSIKAGVWQPYNEAIQNTLAGLIGEGQVGSARGGLSGSALDIMSNTISKAGTAYGQQLWNMVNPNMMAAWQMPYQAAMGSLGGSMPDQVVNPGQTSPLSSILPLMMMMGGGQGGGIGSIFNNMFGSGLGSSSMPSYYSHLGGL